MDRFGNDDAGFSVDFDATAITIAVHGWGFWSAEIASAFDTTVRKVCSRSPKGASLLIDMSHLKPMREEGQRAFARLMGELRALGIVKTIVTTTSQLTKLQLIRLSAEAGAAASVQFT
jgi:hypothetical protein